RRLLRVSILWLSLRLSISVLRARAGLLCAEPDGCPTAGLRATTDRATSSAATVQQLSTGRRAAADFPIATSRCASEQQHHAAMGSRPLGHQTDLCRRRQPTGFGAAVRSKLAAAIATPERAVKH